MSLFVHFSAFFQDLSNITKTLKPMKVNVFEFFYNLESIISECSEKKFSLSGSQNRDARIQLYKFMVIIYTLLLYKIRCSSNCASVANQSRVEVKND